MLENYFICPECEGAVMEYVDSECKLEMCPRCGYERGN